MRGASGRDLAEQLTATRAARPMRRNITLRRQRLYRPATDPLRELLDAVEARRSPLSIFFLLLQVAQSLGAATALTAAHEDHGAGGAAGDDAGWRTDHPPLLEQVGAKHRGQRLLGEVRHP